MGKFILGIIVAMIAIAVVGYTYTSQGFANTRADQKPSALERKILGGAMDASAERHAPNVQDPIPPTDENLLAGAKIYNENCGVCHGSPAQPMGQVGISLNPPAPQFLRHAPDMPDNQNYYITRHGVRMTGMPAWGEQMNDNQLWTVTTFLGHMGKLPPQVEAQWKQMPATMIAAAPNPVEPQQKQQGAQEGAKGGATQEQPEHQHNH
jgi:mono/diheme cytochrome c family protein